MALRLRQQESVRKVVTCLFPYVSMFLWGYVSMYTPRSVPVRLLNLLEEAIQASWAGSIFLGGVQEGAVDGALAV